MGEDNFADEKFSDLVRCGFLGDSGIAFAYEHDSNREEGKRTEFRISNGYVLKEIPIYVSRKGFDEIAELGRSF